MDGRGTGDPDRRISERGTSGYGTASRPDKKHDNAAGIQDGTCAPSNDWSAAELAILKEWYLIEGGEVEKRLPGKSRNAIRAQAQRSGLIKKPDGVMKRIRFFGHTILLRDQMLLSVSMVGHASPCGFTRRSLGFTANKN